jgi:hypothetical protein
VGKLKETLILSLNIVLLQSVRQCDFILGIQVFWDFTPY